MLYNTPSLKNGGEQFSSILLFHRQFHEEHPPLFRSFGFGPDSATMSFDELPGNHFLDMPDTLLLH